jgi:glutaredoxin-like protein NrdH
MLEELQDIYDDTIFVYSTPNCSQCRMTYSALDRAGLEYQVIDLSKDPDMLAQLRVEGYTQAPVVKVNGRTWTGFRPDFIKELAR